MIIKFRDDMEKSTRIRIGAMKELRSITGLPLKPAVEIIDRVIAGEEMMVDIPSYHGSAELSRFIKIMYDFGLIVAEELDEDSAAYDSAAYFVDVSNEPCCDYREEIERRILLIYRDQNIYNQRCSWPPKEVPMMENLTGAEILDLYELTVARNSMPRG